MASTTGLRGRTRVVLAAAAGAVLLAGCGDDAEPRGGAQAGDQLPSEMQPGGGSTGDTQAPDAWEEHVRGNQPDWIENVFPPPGSEVGSVREVQVTHTAVEDFDGVRLVIDGVDVTAFAEPRPGRLAYDPNRPRAPVELGPGTHRATAVRVRLDEEGQVHEVVGRFGWQFTVE